MLTSAERGMQAAVPRRPRDRDGDPAAGEGGQDAAHQVVRGAARGRRLRRPRPARRPQAQPHPVRQLRCAALPCFPCMLLFNSAAACWHVHHSAGRCRPLDCPSAIRALGSWRKAGAPHPVRRRVQASTLMGTRVARPGYVPGDAPGSSGHFAPEAAGGIAQPCHRQPGPGYFVHRPSTLTKWIACCRLSMVSQDLLQRSGWTTEVGAVLMCNTLFVLS